MSLREVLRRTGLLPWAREVRALVRRVGFLPENLRYWRGPREALPVPPLRHCGRHGLPRSLLEE